MQVILKEPSQNGAYTSPHSWDDEVLPDQNHAWIPDELDLTEFFRYKGFVTLSIEDNVVTDITPNQEAYDIWMAEHPEPDLLSKAKEARQEENKLALATWLTDHPLTWSDGNTYGVTEADQTEMALNLQQYQVQKSAGREVVLKWHTQKKHSHSFTEEEYNTLMLAIIDYVHPYRQYQEYIKETIYNTESIEGIQNITINYASVNTLFQVCLEHL